MGQRAEWGGDLSPDFSPRAAARHARRWLADNRPDAKTIAASARDANAAQTIAAARGHRQRADYWSAYRAVLVAAIEGR